MEITLLNYSGAYRFVSKWIVCFSVGLFNITHSKLKIHMTPKLICGHFYTWWHSCVNMCFNMCVNTCASMSGILKPCVYIYFKIKAKGAEGKQLTSFNLSISLCHALTLLRSTYTQCKHMKWQTWPYKPVMCLVKPPVYGGGIVSVCESSAFITLYTWSAPVHCSPPCLFITRVAQWKLITLKLWLTHPHCFVCLPISAHCSLICACQP